MNATSSVAVLCLALLAPAVFAQAPPESTAPRGSTSPGTPPPAAPSEKETEGDLWMEAIRGFSVRQREEAVDRARTTLDLVDRRILAWQTRIDRDWQRMDAATRARARQILSDLHRQRVEVAAWYGGLRHSSAEAWGDVRTGFANSYRQLAASMRRARAEFERPGAGKEDDGTDSNPSDTKRSD